MKAAQDEFEADAIERLNERADPEWHQYGFPALLQTVLNSLRFEKLPAEKISAFTGKILDAKRSEEIRRQRLERWNEKANNPDSESE